MISLPVLKWVASLTDEDLRVGYADAVDWIYEAFEDVDRLPLIATGLMECGWNPSEPEAGPYVDDVAQAILLEIAGRWAHSYDGPVPSET